MIKKLILIWLFSIALTGNANSQHWQSLNLELNHSPRSFYSDSAIDKLFIGGGFSYVDSVWTNRIFTWDGFNFQPIGNTLTNGWVSQVYSIARYNNDIYLAVGDTFMPRWNGSQWDFLGGGVNSSISSLYVYNNELFVGGYFTQIGGLQANIIAKWDGLQWHSLNFPISGGSVHSIAMYKGELYIGGDIDDSTGNQTCVARWDGTNWNGLGNGLRGFFAGISDMIVYKGELYVAGSFSKTDYSGNPGNYIARWDSTNWSDVGGGVIGIGGGNGQIYDLIVYNDELYAVGVFSFAGNIPAQYIAKWDGTKWCGLGSEFGNYSVDVLGVYQDMLYVGGSFQSIDGDSTIKRIAKWTGGNYVDTCGSASGIDELTANQNKLQLFPNPFANSTTLQTTIPLQNASLFIFDILGKKVKSIENLNGTEIIISSDCMQSGMYFFTLTDKKGFIGNGKLIIE